MNILMIHPHDIFSAQEPWTIRISMLAREFTYQGHAVKLVYFPLDCERSASITDTGVENIPLSRRAGIAPLLRSIRIVRELGQWADIIHVQKCFHHATLPAVLAALRLNKPLHYDWDDWELKIFLDRPDDVRKKPALWLPLLYLYLWESSLPKLCDSASSSSERLKTELLRAGMDPRDITKAWVGADTDLFHPQVCGTRIRERYNIRMPLVLYAGQLHGSQYATLFIRAAKYLVTKYGPRQFMIVGTGSQLEDLQGLAKHLHIDRYLIFTGAVPHQDMPMYLSAADVVVACFEDTEVTRCKSPLKLAEYMASGKAIVASGVGEVKYMLGGAGIITRPGDVLDLSDGILRLLQDERLRARMGEAARRRAEELLTWKHTADNLLTVYRRSLRSGKPDKNNRCADKKTMK